MDSVNDNINVENDLEGLVAIDPDTGEFDPDLIPDYMRPMVEEMAKGMIAPKAPRQRCKRKPKPRKKQSKTYGKNKKK
jgi:hypothetical protein